MNTNRIRQLDAWRGIAASVVFFHHLFVNFREPFHSLRLHFDSAYQFARFVSELNVVAVLLFFVISGFNIHLSAHQLNMAQPDDVNLYIYRRLKRLLPLYYVALVLTLSIGIASSNSSEDFSARTLIGNIFFMQTPASDRGNWFVPYGGNYPLWSISFEMFFYVCYPLISRYLGRHDSRPEFVKQGSLIALGFSVFGLFVYNILPNPLALFASHFVIWYAGVVLAEAYLGKADSRVAFGIIAALLGSATLSASLVESAIISLIRTGLVIALGWIGLWMLPPVYKDKNSSPHQSDNFNFFPDWVLQLCRVSISLSANKFLQTS